MRILFGNVGGLVFAASVSLAGSVALAQTEDTPVVDPAVIDILEQATEFLAAQQVVSVNWLVSTDDVVDGREKLTTTRSGFTLLDRDQGFFAYTENGLKTREFYFDGGAFQIVDVEENAYVETPFSGSFEELVERVRDEYDVVLPIWSILSQQSRFEILDIAEAAAYVGLTRVAGREAHHVALSDYDEDWQVWISTEPDRPEIIMLVGTDPHTQGWPQYRAYFTDWNFAPEVSEGDFTFVPGDGTDRMSWPKIGRAVEEDRTVEREEAVDKAADE